MINLIILFQINDSVWFLIILMCTICSLEIHHSIRYIEKKENNIKLEKPKGQWDN